MLDIPDQTRREQIRLVERLDYTFNKASFLVEAITHRSAAAANNERLEFLGDGILNFVIAADLFSRKPESPEGDLSRIRASLVNKDTLADIARDLDLGSCLILGSGELKSGGFRRSSILADTLEAIFGAVYLDGGFDECKRVILTLFSKKLSDIPDASTLKDPKTRLQEILQSRHFQIPVYTIIDVSGKSHQQIFSVECRIDDVDCIAVASGSSRRKAEQAAAQEALAQVEVKLHR